MPGSVITTEYV